MPRLGASTRRFVAAGAVLLAAQLLVGSAFAGDGTMRPPPPNGIPAVRSFLVLFDFNASRLTWKTRGVVASVALAIRFRGERKVRVVGYADGAEAHGLALSLRRARVVRAELIRDGVMGVDIAILGNAARDLLVPEASGASRSLNPRAVIEF